MLYVVNTASYLRSNRVRNGSIHDCYPEYFTVQHNLPKSVTRAEHAEMESNRAPS